MTSARKTLFDSNYKNIRHKARFTRRNGSTHKCVHCPWHSCWRRPRRVDAHMQFYLSKRLRSALCFHPVWENIHLCACACACACVCVWVSVCNAPWKAIHALTRERWKMTNHESRTILDLESLSAPASTSTRKQSVWPNKAAQISAVLPPWFKEEHCVINWRNWHRLNLSEPTSRSQPRNPISHSQTHSSIPRKREVKCAWLRRVINMRVKAELTYQSKNYQWNTKIYRRGRSSLAGWLNQTMFNTRRNFLQLNSDTNMDHALRTWLPCQPHSPKADPKSRYDQIQQPPSAPSNDSVGADSKF